LRFGVLETDALKAAADARLDLGFGDALQTP
jgi:hypothetical protein